MTEFDIKAADWDKDPMHWDRSEAIANEIIKLIHGGYLAIADLYEEDGSFHGEGFTGHRGFNINDLSDIVRKHNFENISHRTCFTIERKISDSEIKQYRVFLLIANLE